MSDYYQLWSTLFLVKDYLIQYDIEGFTSFDLTNNINDKYGNSFKIPAKSAEDVVYFLKFYNLLNQLTEKDINKLHKSKGFDNFDEIYLVLIV